MIFDTWVHPLMMGLEEHLITMFRHDFEFTEGHRSHLGHAPQAPAPETTAQVAATAAGGPSWTAAGEAELAKIPFFVRGKARRNTESFARERGLARIDAETLYEAKAAFSR